MDSTEEQRRRVRLEITRIHRERVTVAKLLTLLRRGTAILRKRLRTLNADLVKARASADKLR